MFCYKKTLSLILVFLLFFPSFVFAIDNTTNTTTATKLQDLTYTYDNIGNIAKIIDNSPNQLAKTSTYQYDSLYRLTQADIINSANNQNYTQTYQYDSIGNILNKSDQGTYQYNQTSYANPHAVTNITNGKTFTYDKNGNLENDGTWTHTWDYNNRLIQSAPLTRGVGGFNTIVYAYDSTGNRITKTDNTKTTYYINQYYDIENGAVKKHIFAGGDKVATIENNNTYYHHTDHLTGSNVDTDSTGNVLESIDYYPFGSVRVDSKVAGYENDYKYTGKELDTDTGLYYYGARYYDGKIGRFVGEDNAFWAVGIGRLKQITGQDLKQYLTDPQNFNSYGYARNNPLKYNDPNGEWAVPAVAIVVGAWSAYGALSHPQPIGDNAGKVASLTVQAGQISKDIAGGEVVGAGIGKAFGAVVGKITSTVKQVASEASEVVSSTVKWPGPNEGRQVINGLEYTMHALDRMVPKGLTQKGTDMFSRGIPPSVVENAIKFGEKILQKDNTIRHIYDNVHIITNKAVSEVITVIRTGVIKK